MCISITIITATIFLKNLHLHHCFYPGLGIASAIENHWFSFCDIHHYYCEMGTSQALISGNQEYIWIHPDHKIIYVFLVPELLVNFHSLIHLQ
ncbi:hypothetical protein ACJX0J_036757, partial [Zea mays]